MVQDASRVSFSGNLGLMVSRLRFSHFLVSMSVAAVLATSLVSYLGYRLLRSEFPDVMPLKGQYPVVIYRGRGKEPDVVLQKARPPGWTSLSEVSRSAVGAIIVSEDWGFYGHKGYDPKEIKEAIKEDLEAGSFVRGASTITQQVAKNVFLSRDKNLWRKFKEFILATELEEKVGKRKILESYLNVAEWGEGVFGIRRAAQVYFGKSPGALTPKEGAFLAMLLPSPKKYSVSYRNRALTPYARRTIRSILGKMTQARYIAPEERDRQLVTPLSFERTLESAQSDDGSADKEEGGSDEDSEESNDGVLTAPAEENDSEKEKF